MLYLALKEAFCGQNKCLKTEKFLGDYEEQTFYANCGDVAQKNSYSSDLEVNLNYDLLVYLQQISYCQIYHFNNCEEKYQIKLNAFIQT